MKRLSLVILWQIIFVSLYSQPFNFKHLEVADGLSNNSVYAILKDKDGFMWFGTNAGLNRFDGYTFKVFRHLHDDKHSQLRKRNNRKSQWKFMDKNGDRIHYVRQSGQPVQ